MVKTKVPSPSHTTAFLAHGIFLGPAPCSCFIFVPVRLIHVSNLWHQRIIWIRVRQQRTDWKQNLKDKKSKQFYTHKNYLLNFSKQFLCTVSNGDLYTWPWKLKGLITPPSVGGWFGHSRGGLRAWLMEGLFCQQLLVDGGWMWQVVVRGGYRVNEL
jgi:hypothetical protein